MREMNNFLALFNTACDEAISISAAFLSPKVRVNEQMNSKKTIYLPFLDPLTEST